MVHLLELPLRLRRYVKKEGGGGIGISITAAKGIVVDSDIQGVEFVFLG